MCSSARQAGWSWSLLNMQFHFSLWVSPAQRHTWFEKTKDRVRTSPYHKARYLCLCLPVGGLRNTGLTQCDGLRNHWGYYYRFNHFYNGTEIVQRHHRPRKPTHICVILPPDEVTGWIIATRFSTRVSTVTMSGSPLFCTVFVSRISYSVLSPTIKLHLVAL